MFASSLCEEVQHATKAGELRRAVQHRVQILTGYTRYCVTAVGRARTDAGGCLRASSAASANLRMSIQDHGGQCWWQLWRSTGALREAGQAAEHGP